MNARTLSLSALLALSFVGVRAARADDPPMPGGAPPAPEAKVVERGYLGFSPVPATLIADDVRAKMKVSAKAGVVVMQVFPGGPAAKAGMKVGDVLLKIGGKDLPDASGIDPALPATLQKFKDDFAKIAEATMKVGAEVEVVVEREGKPVTLKATAISKAAMETLAKAAEDEDGEEDEGKEGPEGKEAPEGAKPAAPPAAPAAPSAPAATEATRGFVGFMAVPAAAIPAKLRAKWKVTADHGVVAIRITKGSPAEKAGLVRGDVVVKYAGTDVPTDKEIEAAKEDAPKLVSEAFLKISLASVKPAGEVAIVVMRDGKPVTLKATAIGAADMQKVAASAGEDEDDEGDEEDEAKEGK